MNRAEYDKQKIKNKKVFNQGCIESFNQELDELRELYGEHILDFYYSEHLGEWILRSENDTHDMKEFESKAGLLEYLELQA